MNSTGEDLYFYIIIKVIFKIYKNTLYKNTSLNKTFKTTLLVL